NKRFHVIWCDESLGNAATLRDAVLLASEGSLIHPRDGVPVTFLKVSRNLDKWLLCGQGGSTDPRKIQWGEERQPFGRIGLAPRLLAPVSATQPGRQEPAVSAQPVARSAHSRPNSSNTRPRSRTLLERLALIEPSPRKPRTGS
ncbi:MAG: hypothetical protein M3Y67_02775, partial [Pseudomonadota bacterium]|nr:hypothetical protein [Pseudomonadota bacterium]